jgi:serine/threonine protein kinase
VDDQGNAKITDFGLTFQTDSRSSTQSDEMQGSIRWMAPELYMGFIEEYGKWGPTFKSDVYSFAHTIVEVFFPIAQYRERN